MKIAKRSQSSLMRDIMLNPNGLAQARMNDNFFDFFDSSFGRTKNNINVDIVEKEIIFWLGQNDREKDA